MIIRVVLSKLVLVRLKIFGLSQSWSHVRDVQLCVNLLGIPYPPQTQNRAELSLMKFHEATSHIFGLQTSRLHHVEELNNMFFTVWGSNGCGFTGTSAPVTHWSFNTAVGVLELSQLLVASAICFRTWHAMLCPHCHFLVKYYRSSPWKLFTLW